MSESIDHYLANDPDFLRGYNDPTNGLFVASLYGRDGQLDKAMLRAYIGQMYRQGHRAKRRRRMRFQCQDTVAGSHVRDTCDIMAVFHRGQHLSEACWEWAFDHAPSYAFTAE